MAKDNRDIVRAVRYGSPARLYKSGQEDELQAVLTERDGRRLIANGTLVGDNWQFGSTKSAPAPAPVATPRAFGAGLKPKVVEALAAAGITSAEEAQALTDQELEDLPGIGLAAVRDIREFYPHTGEAE